MRKIGLKLSVNVENIEKARLFKGQKGTYLDMAVFVDLDEQDQYGNNGMIVHAKQKGEEGQTPILGNAKIFWSDREDGARHASGNKAQNNPTYDSFDDDIPF